VGPKDRARPYAQRTGPKNVTLIANMIVQTGKPDRPPAATAPVAPGVFGQGTLSRDPDLPGPPQDSDFASLLAGEKNSAAGQEETPAPILAEDPATGIRKPDTAAVKFDGGLAADLADLGEKITDALDQLSRGETPGGNDLAQLAEKITELLAKLSDRMDKAGPAGPLDPTRSEIELAKIGIGFVVAALADQIAPAGATINRSPLTGLIEQLVQNLGGQTADSPQANATGGPQANGAGPNVTAGPGSVQLFNSLSAQGPGTGAETGSAIPAPAQPPGSPLARDLLVLQDLISALRGTQGGTNGPTQLVANGQAGPVPVGPAQPGMEGRAQPQDWVQRLLGSTALTPGVQTPKSDQSITGRQAADPTRTPPGNQTTDPVGPRPAPSLIPSVIPSLTPSLTGPLQPGATANAGPRPGPELLNANALSPPSTDGGPTGEKLLSPGQVVRPDPGTRTPASPAASGSGTAQGATPAGIFGSPSPATAGQGATPDTPLNTQNAPPVPPAPANSPLNVPPGLFPAAAGAPLDAALRLEFVNAVRPPAPQINLPALAVTIARQATNGTTSFQVRLDPPELGRIDVRLEVDGSQLRAKLVVDRPETLDLLQRDARALERALGQSGLSSDRASLEFSLRQNPSGDQNQSGRQNDTQRADGGPGRSDANVDPAAPDPARPPVYMTPGGVSLWV
jgi:flagellar hook-length control protein FliK